MSDCDFDSNGGGDVVMVIVVMASVIELDRCARVDSRGGERYGEGDGDDGDIN